VARVVARESGHSERREHSGTCVLLSVQVACPGRCAGLLVMRRSGVRLSKAAPLENPPLPGVSAGRRVVLISTSSSNGSNLPEMSPTSRAACRKLASIMCHTSPSSSPQLRARAPAEPPSGPRQRPATPTLPYDADHERGSLGHLQPTSPRSPGGSYRPLGWHSQVSRHVAAVAMLLRGHPRWRQRRLWRGQRRPSCVCCTGAAR
jgi:hypothetical protein